MAATNYHHEPINKPQGRHEGPAVSQVPCPLRAGLAPELSLSPWAPGFHILHRPAASHLGPMPRSGSELMPHPGYRRTLRQLGARRGRAWQDPGRPAPSLPMARVWLPFSVQKPDSFGSGGGRRGGLARRSRSGPPTPRVGYQAWRGPLGTCISSLSRSLCRHSERQPRGPPACAWPTSLLLSEKQTVPAE